MEKLCPKGHAEGWYSGKRQKCIACVKVWNASRYQKHRAVLAARSAQWRREHPDYVKKYEKENAEKRLWLTAKRGVKQFSVPFDLEVADIEIPEFCPVLGIKLERGTGSRTDASPSLDRVVPEKGYVKGNVVVVSWRVNRLKNSASVEELLKIASFYKKYVR